MSELIYNIPQTYLDEIRELEEILLWGKPLKDMEHINFVHVEEGSQFFVKLSGIIQTIKSLRKRLQDKHTKKKTYPSENGERIYCYGTSLKEDVEYIIKGLENSIERGYEIEKQDLVIKSPPRDGYSVVTVPAGSLIVPPGREKEWAEKILRELPPVIDAKDTRIITQEELNWFKKIEEEKTKVLEDYLFRHENAISAVNVFLQATGITSPALASAIRQGWPHRTDKDLAENKEDNTSQKPLFPLVMYSPDGRKYFYRSEKFVYGRMEAMYEGTWHDGRKHRTFMSRMLEQGYTETPPPKPMRSREETLKQIKDCEAAIHGMDGTSYVSEMKAVIGCLKWVLNEE